MKKELVLDKASRLKMAGRLRAVAWRQMVKAAAMLRDADALEDARATEDDCEILQCVSCNAPFPLWRGERDWYETKVRESGQAWPLPRRCGDCRALRRAYRRRGEVTK